MNYLDNARKIPVYPKKYRVCSGEGIANIEAFP